MVAAMRAAGIKRLVIITPPPVYDEGRIRHQQQVGLRVGLGGEG
jgi:hypothetical protein